MDENYARKAGKLIEILERLLADSYQLRAQNCALREALVTLASGVLQRPGLELLDSLEDCERQWHQWILEHIEDFSPSTAAMLDRRKLSQIWTAPADEDKQT